MRLIYVIILVFFCIVVIELLEINVFLRIRNYFYILGSQNIFFNEFLKMYLKLYIDFFEKDNNFRKIKYKYFKCIIIEDLKQ